MGGLSTGGGSSAVAASAHAGCLRFRHTDPLVTGVTRRGLAKKLGHPDTSAGIPEARWMRAMTFETLVRNEKFVSQLLTTTVGRLELARPEAVRRADGKVTVGATAIVLQQAHLKATHERIATMVTGLAVPFPGMEFVAGATPVKPDFAIVAPRYLVGEDGTEDDGEGRPIGTWLVMGDAKDYERVRSRIDDQRMLKGFLQVALGAAAAQAWSKVPTGMAVHSWGALAVPRNMFLQPEAIVECLDDHRAEVMDRVRERQEVVEAHQGSVIAPHELDDWVRHLEAAFDPGTCPSCSMFSLCRDEVRSSPEPAARLIELGIPASQRPVLLGLVDGSGEIPSGASASAVAAVTASMTGRVGNTGQRRTDPVGLKGTIDVLIAKSDAAALGLHGLALRDGGDADAPWQTTVYEDPLAPATRLDVMARIGRALDAALEAVNGLGHPVHLVMPDTVTADVLVSMADSLAGVEISRLRWERDIEAGREPLTFDGQPATVPDALTLHQRLAVSFLLEADRSRAVTLRSALVDARRILANHVVPGGPRSDALRLDHLVTWADADTDLDHRAVSDEIAGSIHTPGARLSNKQSDAIHAVSRRGNNTRRGHEPAQYDRLVRDELDYKAETLERAKRYLDTLPVSRLRDVHRALEADAQAVWLRRWELHASDLVRFGRVPWWWRNDQVGQLDKDSVLTTQLAALGNPQAAHDMATTAGNRQVALATITSQLPLRVRVRSRRLKAGSRIYLAHSPLGPSVELPTTELKVQKGSFKFRQQWVGLLVADEQTDDDGTLRWEVRMPMIPPVGAELIVLDGDWVSGGFASGHEIALGRPSLDATSSPKENCAEGDFMADPDSHQWCCRPHEEAEASYADELAARRERGELNPQAWPPVVDEDHFDTVAAGTPTEAEVADDSIVPVRPEDLTIDDLD